MSLVSHISPHAARKLNEAGLLTDTAKQQIERRDQLAKRLWMVVAVIFGLTFLGVWYVVSSTQSDKTVSTQQASR